MIEIKPFEERHLKKTFLWLSNETLKKYFLLRRTITWEDHLKWFDCYKQDKSQKVFAIEDSGLHLGNCGFKFINQNDQKAELWIYIGELSFQSKGIATNALRLLLDYGYLNLNFNKIYLHVADFNTKALALYKKFNFKEEGCFLKDYKLEGEFISIFRLYLLKI